jgi:hypothetical protein
LYNEIAIFHRSRKIMLKVDISTRLKGNFI